jgi:hypothetical protein
MHLFQYQTYQEEDKPIDQKFETHQSENDGLFAHLSVDEAVLANRMLAKNSILS